MSEPTKEYGWRFLEKGEEVRKGDESWLCGGGPWRDIQPGHYGHLFNSDEFNPIRRRIDPGEGWEIVPAGSKETLDMEWTFNCGASWVKDAVTCPNVSVSGHAYETLQAFRRRKSVQPTQWLDCMKYAPSPGWIWVLRNDGAVIPLQWGSAGQGRVLLNTPGVKWQRMEVPAAPVPKPPEKSDAEKAWDSRGIYDRTLRDAFIAGFNAAKKG